MAILPGRAFSRQVRVCEDNAIHLRDDNTIYDWPCPSGAVTTCYDASCGRLYELISSILEVREKQLFGVYLLNANGSFAHCQWNHMGLQ